MEVGVHLFDDNYCMQKSHYDTTTMDGKSELCAGVPDWNEDGLIDGGKDACQVGCQYCIIDLFHRFFVARFDVYFNAMQMNYPEQFAL